ncbi:hypothetical protein [Flavobacterium sp. IMCC34518]|uniref:hypothetical protein n=1 Tax=Flavobacterium sp. IMCC34518 TaxID=3003623 RepID=UPI0022AC5B7E|nr:hypothetical protein [Flavobacterium sp. IMCC34518]
MNRVSVLLTIYSEKKYFFIAFLFLTFFNAFAQNETTSKSSDLIPIYQESIAIDESPIKVSTSNINSNVNFILWFMGTKEDVNSKISNDSSTKKSFLTSGREPNHLLLKTLLKKAINTKTC